MKKEKVKKTVKKVKKTVKKVDEKERTFSSYDKMGEEEMEVLFIELYHSPQWQAILKFNRIHHNNVISVLASVDPFKAPTECARAQGTDVGLFTLEAKINNLIGQNKE